MSKRKKTQTLPYKMKRVHSEREQATNETVKRVCYHDVYNAIAYLEGPIVYAGRRIGCLANRGEPYPKVIMESGQELTVNVAWWKDEPHENLFLELIAVTIREPESRIELARTTLPTLFSKVTTFGNLSSGKRAGIGKKIFLTVSTKPSKNCCRERRHCPFWTKLTKK